MSIFSRVLDFLHEHFTWNIRNDVVIEYVRFKRKRNSFEQLVLKGSIFEKDQAREAYKHGGSSVRIFNNDWLANGLKNSGAMLVYLEESSHFKPNSYVIVMFPEEQELEKEKTTLQGAA